ncbi:hypothetical protein FM104_09410 [Microbacterium esteraromaticum]|uniref:Uncharacterized protein n=1 Tax=Microbacterium esteraromaticum TaxID=57043 RepID=A0A1R4JXZ4_9MICO|nr:hypothetical protein FM104_09410 [Microbacterium esteraromaticum]
MLIGRAYSASTPADRIAAFELHVVDQLNNSTVRESVREKLREFITSES